MRDLINFYFFRFAPSLARTSIYNYYLTDLSLLIPTFIFFKSKENFGSAVVIFYFFNRIACARTPHFKTFFNIFLSFYAFFRPLFIYFFLFRGFFVLPWYFIALSVGVLTGNFFALIQPFFFLTINCRRSA